VDHLLQVELGDIIQVQVVTSAGWDYAMKCVVNGVQHQVTHTDWRVTLQLDNTFRADPRLGGPFSLAYSEAYNRLEQ
jgi:hypothetical protein